MPSSQEAEAGGESSRPAGLHKETLKTERMKVKKGRRRKGGREGRERGKERKKEGSTYSYKNLHMSIHSIIYNKKGKVF